MLLFDAKYVPSAAAAAIIREWMAHVESKRWPDECCIEAWLVAHGFADPNCTTPAMAHGAVFGTHERAGRLWDLCLVARAVAQQCGDAESSRRTLLNKLQVLVDRAEG